MLPLPGVRFDPCDWRSVKTDKTGAAAIDANRYPAGPKWRSMRLQAGVRVFEIEPRGPAAKRSPRRRGFGAIRRKPRWIRRACSRSSRESPAYGAKARSGTISPKPCEPCSTAWTHARAPICSTTSEPLPPTAGSPPRSKAVETVINAGRTVDRAAIGTCAKRILEGAGTEGGQDLKRYDKYMKEAE